MADPLTPTEEMSIYEAMRVNSYDLEWTQEATDVVMAIVEDRCAKAVAEHLKSLRMALNAGRPWCWPTTSASTTWRA
jgi:hypothetical protein